MNKVFVRKTSLATPKGNDVRCRTTSPFAGSRHLLYLVSFINMELCCAIQNFIMALTFLQIAPTLLSWVCTRTYITRAWNTFWKFLQYVASSLGTVLPK